MRSIKELAYGMASLFSALRASLPYLFSVKERAKEVTEQYPDPISSRSPEDLPPRSRGMIKNSIEKCTGCGDCVKVCPVQCIQMQTEPGASSTKLWVSVFDIDFSSCSFCGLCVEFCIPNSLSHTHEYELSSSNLLDLSVSYGSGQVTNEQREKWASLRQAREESEI